MPAKKVSHLLHIRINELLDRILQNENRQTKSPEPEASENQEPSKLNLGNQNEPFWVSMESFFQFHFDLSEDLDEWVEERLEENHRESLQREWDPFFDYDSGARQNGDIQRQFSSDLVPKRPK